MNSSAESDPGGGLTDNSEDYTDISTDDDISESHQSDVEFEESDSVSVPSESVQPRNKVTMSMQDILKEMVRQRRLPDEQEMLLSFAAEDVDNDYNNNTAVELFDTPTEDLKLFASFLHYYAPGAYEYIRNNYNTPLPSIKVLGGWCEYDTFRAGFTKQAFDILEKRSTERGKRLICSLVADNLQVFVHNSFVDIDVGAGPLDNNYAYEIDGRSAYVILLVNLEENWKIPVCYFLADQTDKKTEANLITMCLHRSNEVGVDVVSITTTTHVAQSLGCELEDYRKLKTTFKHPASGNPVAVFIDPSLSARSLYHTFHSKKEFLNGQKGKICWEYIEQLRKLLANKAFQFNFSTVMLDLRNMLAKIDLISELVLPSVAGALELCKNRLKLPNFVGAGPTIEYITMINTMYYILYSKVGQCGYKQPICKENAQEILEFLEEAKKYISSISYAKSVVCKSKQLGVQESNFLAEGFKGFLISIESLKHLYATLVEKGPLQCIPTYRLSWDQMDEFFRVIRKHNPRDNGGEFPPIYRRFFEDLKSTLTDCIQIESYPITNYKKALDFIKKTSGKRAFDEMYSVIAEKRHKTDDEKKADANVAKFVKLLDKEQDQARRRQMVGYIAGWTAVQLAKNLRCEECIDTLLTNEKLWLHKLITTKELKAVCLPSEEMFRICWECERSVRGLTELDITAQRRLLSRALRIPQATHRNHHVHLTKAVVAKYLRLRLGIDDTRKTKKPKANFLRNFLKFAM